MKLYEIDDALMECFDAETGEIFDVEKFEALQMEREAKIEGAALAAKNYRADAAAIKAEIDALKKRAATYDKRADGYEYWLTETLKGEAFNTSKCAVTFRPSERTELAADFIEWAMKNNRDDLLNYGKPTANKTAIKAALLGGEKIPAEITKNLNINIK